MALHIIGCGVEGTAVPGLGGEIATRLPYPLGNHVALPT